MDEGAYRNTLSGAQTAKQQLAGVAPCIGSFLDRLIDLRETLSGLDNQMRNHADLMFGQRPIPANAPVQKDGSDNTVDSVLTNIETIVSRLRSECNRF